MSMCDPIDSSPPGSPVPGSLQAGTLEWIVISFSNTWKSKVNGKSFSRVQLLATPRIAAYQAPPSMGFSRQEYWSGLPLPSPLGIPKTCKHSAKAYALVGVTSRLGPWCKRTNTVQKDKGKSLKLPSTLVKIVNKKLHCLLGQECD